MTRETTPTLSVILLAELLFVMFWHVVFLSWLTCVRSSWLTLAPHAGLKVLMQLLHQKLCKHHDIKSRRTLNFWVGLPIFLCIYPPMSWSIGLSVPLYKYSPLRWPNDLSVRWLSGRLWVRSSAESYQRLTKMGQRAVSLGAQH